MSALVLADTVTGMTLPEPIASEYATIRNTTESLGQLERVLGDKTRANEKALSRLYAEIASFNMVNRHTATGDLGVPFTPQDLAATGVLIMFLVGTDDVLAPPRIVSAVHRLVPGSQHVEVPGVGHSAYFEAPNAFNDAVLGFLEGVGVAGDRLGASAG